MWSEVDAAFRRLGEPIVYVSFIGEGTPAESKGFDATLLHFYGACAMLCDSVYLVVEGSTPERAEERARIATALRSKNLRPIVAKTTAELQRLAPRNLREELKLAMDVAVNGAMPASAHFRTSRLQ